MQQTPPRRRIVAAAVTVLVSLAAAPLHAELPPLECLRLVREGRAAALAGDTGTAVERLRAARERFPGELLPLTALLDLETVLGLPESERRSLETTLLERLRDPRAVLPPATLLYLKSWMGDDRRRLETLMEAVERRLAANSEAQDPAVIELAADTATHLGRWQVARDYSGRMLERRPEDLGLLWQCAQLDMMLKRWKSAQKLLGRIARHPQGGGGFVRAERVRVLMHLGRHDEALEELARIEQAPAASASASPIAVQALLYELAWEMRDAGRDEEARALWRRVATGEQAQADQVTADARFEDLSGLRQAAVESLAELYGDPEALAWRAAERQATPEPDAEADPFSGLNRGAQLLAAGEVEAAFEQLGPVAEAMPESEEAWFNFALAAFRLERWEEAARAYGHVAELAPEMAEAHRQQGLALYHLERCTPAVEALERGLALDPQHWQTHYFLAQCYQRLGDAERAQDAWNTYEAVKPAED